MMAGIVQLSLSQILIQHSIQSSNTWQWKRFTTGEDGRMRAQGHNNTSGVRSLLIPVERQIGSPMSDLMYNRMTGIGWRKDTTG
jgi:hypothetical protein